MARFAVIPQEVEQELDRVIEIEHDATKRPPGVSDGFLLGARAALEWVLGDVEERPTEDGETEPDS